MKEENTRFGGVLAVLMLVMAVAPAHAQVDFDLDALFDELPPASENGQPEAPAEDVAPAEAPEAPAVAPVPLPDDEREAALLTAEQERVLRQDREQEGLRMLDEALAAQRRGEHRRAVDLFRQALRRIPDRPATDEARQQILRGYGESLYRMAVTAFDRDELDEARQLAAAALDADESRQAARVRALNRRIDRRQERLELPLPVDQAPELVERREDAAQYFEDGRTYFEAGEYREAERAFERVLLLDPYHRNAMRFLRRLEERRLQRTDLRREATVVDAMRDVRERWHPPIREAVVAPERPVTGDPIDIRARRLQERMRQIVIPTIDFRQGNIVDVIDFLREASIPADPEGIGVNIILQLERGRRGAPSPTPRAPSPAAEDEWGWDVEPRATPAPTAGPVMTDPSDIPAITLSLRRVSLMDAIRYVTEVAGLRYRIEDNAVIITPAGVAIGQIVTRLYPVQPSILDIAVERQEAPRQDFGRTGDFIGMGTQPVEMRRGDVKPFFEQMGVPFPDGTSITYNASISQLIVSNTIENLEIFERILTNLNVIPNQVEIEARFVEIAQTDLESLGFEWMLTDNFNIATRPGSDALGMRERIQLNRNDQTGGFTSGLRYFATSEATATRGQAGVGTPMAGSILSVSSILTNPELSFVLHALQQRGGSDLLSAPRVTTISGQQADIQVVEEIIYPSEYIEQTTGTGTSGVTIIDGQEVAGTAFRVPYPSAFETREVGVILNVTPTVGPDGYTIDLALAPEVAELVEWLDYGPPDRFPILKPVFASRRANANIIIWDNQTVVMGGLIRDQVTSFDDRVPLLGDLPLIGRFFRSTGQRSSKQNLVIFVTARLVDPAGNPIQQMTGVATAPTVPGAQIPQVD